MMTVKLALTALSQGASLVTQATGLVSLHVRVSLLNIECH